MRKLTHDEISRKRITLEKINEAKKLPVVVILDSIRSAYNVGSIFRTSDGAMIEKLYLGGYTATPENKDVLKTALGSQKSVKWEKVSDPSGVILTLKSKGYRIAALEQTDESFPYYKVPATDFPLALIVGNEITGVSKELIDLCDYSIEIPQFGIKQSLNVAVAYGITIFNFRRKFDELANEI